MELWPLGRTSPARATVEALKKCAPTGPRAGRVRTTLVPFRPPPRPPTARQPLAASCSEKIGSAGPELRMDLWHRPRPSLPCTEMPRAFITGRLSPFRPSRFRAAWPPEHLLAVPPVLQGPPPCPGQRALALSVPPLHLAELNRAPRLLRGARPPRSATPRPRQRRAMWHRPFQEKKKKK